MPSPFSPQFQYMAYVAITCLGAFALGAYVFLPDLDVVQEIREFLRTDWKYLGVAWLLTLGVNKLAKFHVSTEFQSSVYAIEGATVSVFQTVTARPLTMLFVFAYLVGFPFVVLFTYFKLKAHDREQAYRYAAAYACLVLLAAPFFVFVPVQVTGYSLVSVRPLLYDLNSIVMAGTFATDTLMKSFPSLHTGLSTLAAIFAWKTGDRLYAWTVTAAAACIVVSTFYLGIHWLVDAVFAVVLVLIAHEISQRIPLTRGLGSLRGAGRGASDRE